MKFPVVNRFVSHIFLFSLAMFGVLGPHIPFNGHEVIVLLGFLSLAMLMWNMTLCRGEDLPRTQLSPLALSLLIFYFWSALGYFYSVDPDNSFPIMVQYIGVSCLYLALLFRFKEESDTNFFLWTLTSYAGVLALLGIIQQFNFPFLPIPNTTAVGSTSLFLEKNSFATYLLLHIPVVCYLYEKTSSERISIAAWWTFVFLLAGLWFSGCRAGEAVGMIQIFGILAFFYWNGKYKELKVLATGVLVSVLIYLALTAFLDASGIGQERESLYSLVAEGGSTWNNLFTRVVIWQATWEMFKDYWLIGSGPWTYEALYPVYLDKLGETPISDFIGPNAPHPHNLYFQIATESGMIGLILFSIFLFMFYRRCHIVFWNSPVADRSPIFFLVVAVTGFFLHNLVESNWAISSFIYHFTIWVFILDFLDRKRFAKPVEATGVKRNILGMVAGSYVIIGLWFLGSFYIYQQIMFRQIFTIRNLPALQESVSRVQTFCPRCSFPGLALAGAILEEYKRDGHPELIAQAEAVLDRIASTGTLNLVYLLYLGQVRMHQGRMAEARQIFTQIRKFDKLRNAVDKVLLPPSP